MDYKELYELLGKLLKKRAKFDKLYQNRNNIEAIKLDGEFFSRIDGSQNSDLIKKMMGLILEEQASQLEQLETEIIEIIHEEATKYL